MSNKRRTTICASCGVTCLRTRGPLCPRCHQRLPRTIAYQRWRGMIRRCTKPTDSQWVYYGGRGITVCAEWLASFDAYYAHIGDAPAPGLTIDRIDNDGNYEPGNVRWATRGEQNANRRHFLKPECPNGHVFNEQNTYWCPTGARKCRPCGRERAARYRLARVA